VFNPVASVMARAPSNVAYREDAERIEEVPGDPNLGSYLHRGRELETEG
jgi:hypothetical protein